TFIGGSGHDEIRDFDFRGNSIFCVGKTQSGDLGPVLKAGATNTVTHGGGTWDGFVFEFELNTTLNVFQKNWLTYFGGNGMEEFNACKFDAQGNLFVVGNSASTNMTVTGAPGTYTQNFNTSQLSSS